MVAALASVAAQNENPNSYLCLMSRPFLPIGNHQQQQPEQQQRLQRWYSSKPTNPAVVMSNNVNKDDDDSKLPAGRPSPRTSSSTGSTAAMSTPTKTTKMTMATSSSSDSTEKKNKTEGAQPPASMMSVSASVTDSEDEKDNNSSGSGSKEEAGYRRVRTIKVPQYGPDADKAVRSLHNARKERARVKTSINVQRALYGNMLICAAKLGAWVSSGSSSMMSEFV